MDWWGAVSRVRCRRPLADQRVVPPGLAARSRLAAVSSTLTCEVSYDGTAHASAWGSFESKASALTLWSASRA